MPTRCEDFAVAVQPTVAARQNRPSVNPLAPQRYKVQFTVGRDTHDKLRRAQDLMRHVTPEGDLPLIFDRALTLLVADLEKRKLAAAMRRRRQPTVPSGSRHIPNSVRREVWNRDSGQCAFVGAQGRCAERGFLEYHHVKPYAVGGASTVENIQLRCAMHNRYEADLFFGDPEVVRERGAPYAAPAW